VLATAVILSYNRQDVLRRQLLHYANKPVHLIFADGSDADWGSGDSGSIGEMTWEYFRISGWNFIDRYRKAVSKVETEFMFFIDDEECILWTGVEKAVEFLKRNPDHSCAGGRVGRASVGGIGKRPLSKSFSVADWSYFSSSFDLLHDDFRLRLQSLVIENRTANIYYQVHRTELVKKFAETFDEKILELKYLGTTEILFCCFVISHGKWRMDNYPYWFRYGGSTAAPLGTPKYLSDETANETAVYLLRLVEDKFQTVKLQPNKDEFKDLLVRDFLRVHGDHGTKTNSINPKKRLRQKLLPRKALFKLARFKQYLKINLFEIYPTMYERMFRGEATRVKTYSKLFAGGNKNVEKELFVFEDIWSRFPNGLSNSKYEQELARV